MARCSKCGSEVKPGMTFCEVCGKRQDKAAPVRPVPTTTTTTPTPSRQSTPPKSSGRSKSSSSDSVIVKVIKGIAIWFGVIYFILLMASCME